MLGVIRLKVLKLLALRLSHLKKEIVELDDVGELRKVFGWNKFPVLDDPSVYEFDFIEDVNHRRLRDAECLGTVACNTGPTVCVDIGTSTGHSSACIAVNAPQAKIFTVNSSPEEIHAGNAGVLTTAALHREEIGSYYRSRGLKNVEQVLANTAEWEPAVGTVDLAFIDGCHDSDFVYNDTLKILRHMKTGSFLMWHDFNLDLVLKYHWIHSVCLGVEMLFMAGWVKGRIFHIRNSWIGVYRVG